MSDTARNSRRALIALIVLSLIWGYNYVVMKEVMAYVDPFDFSALRMVLGAMVLFAVLVLMRRPLAPVAWRKLLLLGLLQTTAFTALLQWALVDGDAGKTAILVYTMPFWVIPLAWWALGERVRSVQWVALALAGVGLIIIVEPWAHSGSMFSSVLGVASGLSWAISSVLAKSLRRDSGVDLLTMTAWQMLLGSIVLCVIALILPSRPIEPTPYFYAAMIYNVLLATGLAWILWMFVLENLSAGMAGLSVLGIPLIGVFAGWAELGERPSAAELAGMVLICGALALVSLWSLWQNRRRN